MTRIRVRGFQIFRDRTGRMRCYHRATRHAIDLRAAPLGSAAFFAECERIRQIVRARKAAAPVADSLGTLMQHYRESAKFRDLSPRTRKDYGECLEVLHRVRDFRVGDIDTPFVTRLRDLVAKRHGWHRANRIVSVLSQVFREAIPAGLARSNPTRDVIPLRRPKDLPYANRPWTPAELATVLDAAPPHIRVAIALMAMTGLDPSDAVRLRRDQFDGDVIWTERAKTGVRVAIPVIPALRKALDAAPAHDAETVLANSRGKPWAYSALYHAFKGQRGMLEAKGVIDPGLTLKGLRHTVATTLREAGVDERSIADILGQRTQAMALHYSRSADLAEKNRRTMVVLQNALVKRPTHGVKRFPGGKHDA